MKTRFTIFTLFLCCVALTGCAKDTAQWHSLSTQKPDGIGGIAIIDNEHFLVVHDGKKPEHSRLGIVTWQKDQKPTLSKLDWCDQTKLPIDLEAITAIPNHNGEYLVLESKGKVTRIQLDGSKACKTSAQFELPTANANSNMEAIALHCFTQGCVLVWAERGDDKQAAKLSWANFDVNNNSVATSQGKPFEFKASYPSNNIRSISDIAIDNKGLVWVSAVADSGDDGFFQSALYRLGNFSESGAKISWIPSADNVAPIAKYETENIKIEGILFIDKGLIMATDDENKGSKIAIKK